MSIVKMYDALEEAQDALLVAFAAAKWNLSRLDRERVHAAIIRAREVIASHEFESQRKAHIQVAMEDAILRMDAADLSATAEYNGLWEALAAFVGVGEIEYRRAFWRVDEKGRQHRKNPLRDGEGGGFGP